MSSLKALAAELRAIDAAMSRIDGASESFLAKVPAAQRPSAANLLHYLVLRRHDLRHAQLRSICSPASSGHRPPAHA